jgi:hypothetical protein
MKNIHKKFWDGGIITKPPTERSSAYANCKYNDYFNLGLFLEVDRAKMARQNGQETLEVKCSCPDPHRSLVGSLSPAVRILSCI